MTPRFCVVLAALLPLGACAAPLYRACMKNPLDVASCQPALEGRADLEADDKLDAKQVANLQARVLEDHELMCEGDDAAVTALVKDLLPAEDPATIPALTLSEGVAYARARSCAYLGMNVLGVGVQLPGLPQPHPRAAQSGADAARAVALIAKSCAQLAALPTRREEPKSLAYTWYRAPSVLACTLLGDAYALGIVDLDLTRAAASYQAACSAEEYVHWWRDDFVTCKERPCPRKQIEEEAARFHEAFEGQRYACEAVHPADRAQDCLRTKDCLDVAEKAPRPVYLGGTVWATLGVQRWRAATHGLEVARQGAVTAAASAAYGERLQQLSSKIANLSPSEQVNAVGRELSERQGNLEERATLGLPIYAPIVLAALPRIAAKEEYFAVAESTNAIQTSAVEGDPRWAALRTAVVKFRAEAAAYYVRKVAAAGGRLAAAATYGVLADSFGAKLVDRVALRRSFRDATQVSIKLPAPWGACGFLTGATVPSSGPIGPSTEVDFAFTTCKKGERPVGSRSPSTPAHSTTRVTRSERRTFTRTVPDCHTVYTRTCTGKESWSCYTSGSKQECNGTKTESYQADVEVAHDEERSSAAGNAGERFIDIEGDVTAQLGARRLKVPFVFKKSLEGTGSFDSLASDANAALYAILAHSIRDHFRAELAKDAVAAGDVAARAGKSDEADDAYLTAVGYGGSFTPSMSAWFDKRWSLGEKRVRELVDLAQ
jgi:hypothetical protein